MGGGRVSVSKGRDKAEKVFVLSLGSHSLHPNDTDSVDCRRGLRKVPRIPIRVK